MKKNYWILLICFLAGGFVGCSDDGDDYNWKEAFENEQVLIRDFVKDKNATAIKYEYMYRGEDITDYVYVFNYDKEGVKPKMGQYVWYNYTQKNFSGNVLDATDMSVAVGAGITPYFQLGGPICVQINPDTAKYTDPLGDALKYMSEGGKGELIISSVMAMLPSYVYRVCEIEKIVEQPTIAEYEDVLIDKYIADLEDGVKEIREVTYEANDTITKIAMLEQAEGPLVEATDSVKIWFEGEILDEFNTPLRKFFTMKADASITVIPNKWSPKGLRLALLKLRAGEEAYVLLSSGAAYGYAGGFNISTGQCNVPPYSTLLYKIKIISTKQNKKD